MVIRTWAGKQNGVTQERIKKTGRERTFIEALKS